MTTPGICTTATCIRCIYRRAQEIGRLGPFAYQPADWPAEPDPPFDLPASEVVTNVVQRVPHTFAEH